MNGKPAISEEHYLLYPDEGFIQVHEQLDMNPPPSVTSRFAPGPPFRGGDVSWNKVLLSEGLITLAGEFGLIIQSKDGGETWVRRNTKIVPREPEPAYWMSGVQNGDNPGWLVQLGSMPLVKITVKLGKITQTRPRRYLWHRLS